MRFPAALVALGLLAGCATTTVVECPPLPEHDPQHWSQLSDEVRGLPEGEFPTIEQSLREYIVTRQGCST